MIEDPKGLITLTIVEINRDKIRLGIEADSEQGVLRDELLLDPEDMANLTAEVQKALSQARDRLAKGLTKRRSRGTRGRRR